MHQRCYVHHPEFNDGKWYMMLEYIGPDSKDGGRLTKVGGFNEKFSPVDNEQGMKNEAIYSGWISRDGNEWEKQTSATLDPTSKLSGKKGHKIYGELDTKTLDDDTGEQGFSVATCGCKVGRCCPKHTECKANGLQHTGARSLSVPKPARMPAALTQFITEVMPMDGCPARCSTCKAGGAAGGGVALVNGKCENWCSRKAYCGASKAFKSGGTDCTGCSPRDSGESTEKAEPPAPRTDLSPFAEKILNEHNKYRCIHGLEYYSWDDKIAAKAQEWAKQPGSKHSSSGFRTFPNDVWTGYHGENLYFGPTSNQVWAAGFATFLWYDEIKKTPGGKGVVKGTDEWSPATGHYILMMEPGMRQLGCGIAARIVCIYGPGAEGPIPPYPVPGPVRDSATCQTF